MIRRFERLLSLVFRLMLALVVVAALGIGVLFLRLDHGPLPVTILTPLIESALAPPGGAFEVHIAETELSLTEDRRSLVVLARDVALIGRSGAQARVPELSLGLSLEALLKGMVAPTRIVVEQPRLRVIRAADGSFELGLGEEEKTEDGADRIQDDATTPDLAHQIVEDFLRPPERGRPLSYLRELRITGARLDVADRMLGLAWHAPRASARLQRSETGSNGDFALSLDLGGVPAELHGDFRYDIAAQRLAVQLAVAEVNPSEIARMMPALAPLAAVEAPVGGTLSLALDTSGARLEGARLDLDVGRGALVDPHLTGGRLALAGGTLKASYEPATARLTLHQLSLDFGGPAVGLTGAIEGIDAARLLQDPGTIGRDRDLVLALNATAERMPTAELPWYWPPDMARNAREWVLKNIHDGGVPEAHLATKLTLARNEAGEFAVTVEKLSGGYTMQDLTVDYRPPLPPVGKVSGSAIFDDKTMTFFPTAGALAGLRVSAGRIYITGLDVKDQDIDIWVDVAGPLRDALEVIDSKPFQYAHEVGLEPARTGGTVAGKLVFRFPLEKKLTFDQIQLQATAQATNAAIQKVALGQDLTEGALALSLDRAGMKIEGTAKLGGTPAKLQVQQSFRAKDQVKSRVAVKTTLDDAARQRLGLVAPAEAALAGPVGVDVLWTSYGGQRGEAQIDYDATQASLVAPDLNYAKAAGTAAAGRIVLDIQSEKIAAVREATMKGPGVDIRAAAILADNELRRLELKRLIVGETDAEGVVAKRPEGGWRVEASGLALDATGLMTRLSKPSPDKNAPDVPLAIDAKLGRVVLGQKREARDVVLQFLRDAQHWQTLRLEARPYGRSELRLRYGQAGGKRPFSFAASDLGDVLLLLDISDHVKGGHVSAEGEALDDAQGRKFAGRFEGGDYSIIGAPAFAKLLSLASFTSLASLLNGDGMPFSNLEGDFVLRDGKVTLRNARTWGGALGINAAGIIDLDSSVLDLEGTLVPAYTLNTILGNIPIIGNLLQGGEGQGLFAASFRAAGAFDDPQISVNPLTALAPGFLKNLFMPDAPAADAAVPRRKAPAPPQPPSAPRQESQNGR